MIESSHLVLVAACILSAVTGCRSNTRMPMPDALRSEGLNLVSVPTQLRIRPASSGRIEFQLHDERGPVSDYPIDFAIVAQAGDAGTVEAYLSADRSLTNADGSTVVQVITAGISGESRTAEFFVQGSTEGASPTSVDVVVTSDDYSVDIVPVAADDIVRAGTVIRDEVYFFDTSRCGDIDLTNPLAAPSRPRTVQAGEAGSAFRYLGVSGEGTHAVVGLGLDASNVVRVAGCLDLPGKMLLENEILTATLVLDHLLPIPTGDYLVSSDISLNTPVPAVSAIQSAWQEWTRCPLDPARLWLDCTIDSLTSNSADPDDCVPAAGGEGPIGALLAARRGVALASTSTTAGKSTTPCRDRVDQNGNPSLETLVDGLFASSRTSLGNLNLGGFSDEIGLLLSTIHLTSTMHIVPSGQLNLYDIDHDLVDIRFPAARSPVGFQLSALGLPSLGARGLAATLSSGRVLSLPPHGFSLRLGTTAQYAFDTSSLQAARGAANALALVNAVMSLAKIANSNPPLTGCDAMSAALCDQIGYRRDCLASACASGLVALANKLSNAFSVLDGDGLDFVLFSGSAPVVDSNNNGRADALGTPRSSTVAAGAGLWVAQFSTGLGSAWGNGVWSASATGPSH